MRVDRLLLAAPKSGSGKTVLACGLLAALKARGIRPAAFKCGPDYIDPMFHRRVLGVESRNLDGFFLEPEALLELFVRNAGKADFALIEGVMGYYDGLGGVSSQASAWEAARITGTPAVLVVDGKGASLSLAAEVKGFLEYVPESGIAGVIFNRMNPMMCQRIAPAVERLGVRVFGCVPEEEIFRLESRHLGLAFPDASGEERLAEQIERMGQRLEETVDVDALLSLALCAPELEEKEEKKVVPGPPVTVGIARDDAFCFYYEENLRLLERFGARLKAFSPLKDPALPEGLDGVIFGGGYPELWACQLSENEAMRASVWEAIRGGMPSLAECGGFLYLHRTLEGADGAEYPMADVLPLRAYRLNRLSRFGYVELKTEDGGSIRGHEFHYWESENPGDAWTAKKPLSARSWSCMHAGGGNYWGFPHLYYPSNPTWLEGWLNQCRAYRKKRMEEK